MALFYRSGDVRPRARKNGPQRLLGEFEQIIPLRLILANPGIYLYELKSELVKMFVSEATICRTLRYMTWVAQDKLCTMWHYSSPKSVGVDSWQRSLCMIQSGCDSRNTIRKYAWIQPERARYASFLCVCVYNTSCLIAKDAQ